MTSSHGVVQGYNGLAVVDGQAQIVVHAEAHGSGYEAHLLAPLIEATCLRHPDRTPQRQLTIIKHPEGAPPKRRSKCNEAVQRMRRKFDTPVGRELYSRRMGTVEPVFANIQNKGMRRFTLRGQKKVSAQWKLFTMVHNIEKVAGVASR